MKIGPSLLTRVRNPETARERREATEAEIRDALLQNLRSMCLTRQGTALTCADFGIASVSEMVHSFPDAIAMMARSLRHTIETYEPRLTAVRVKHIPTEDLTLRFEVAAQLAGDKNKTLIQFETNIDTTRRVSIH